MTKELAAKTTEDLMVKNIPAKTAIKNLVDAGVALRDAQLMVLHVLHLMMEALEEEEMRRPT